jgi:nucleoside-diphosphate-sugar epimerase
VVAVSRRPARVPGARSVVLDLAAGDVSGMVGLLTTTRPFAVVNAAGAVWGVTDQELHASNVTLVRNLVEAVSAVACRPRLVHLGSVHEYGAVGCPIREDAEPRPISAYGHSKLLGAGAVLAAVSAGRCDATVLRVVNVSGPGTPRDSLLGRVADQLAAARRERRTAVLRLTPLHAKRDFVDVRDIAAAVHLTALTPGAGPVINVGRGQAVSVRWLVRELIAASGVPAEIVEHEDRATGAERGTGIDAQEIDTTLARAQLGWQARHALGESLTALWAEVLSRA